MKRLLRILRFVVASIILLASLGILWGWWLLHRSLPVEDGMLTVPELKQEVIVDRNTWGVPHIRAKSLEDLLTAQGYVLAQDRLWQMDILRRAAAGELAEIFGRVALETDRESRTLGLRLAAERSATLLSPERRAVLEAYARGINRYITERSGRLPGEFLVLRYEPRPWTPVDSLLVGAYMYKELTNLWRDQIRREKVTSLIGADLARELYTYESQWDHILVGAEAPSTTGLAKLAATAKAPEGSREILAAAPRDSPAPAPRSRWTAAEGLLSAFSEETKAAAGSNNWVVNGARTHSGKPMLANDTHLPLNVPCIWYTIHLTAPGWNVKGFALPGVPLVIIGHNERIAWGVTNTGADVQDLYVETFNPDHPREYRVNGRWVGAEVRREKIPVRDEPDELFDVVLTRHGPVVRQEGTRAYALRWTATEPGGLDLTFPYLGQTRDWTEFRETLRNLSGPAQNFVYADVDGNIGFLVAAKIPIRRKPTGGLPVPGDTDDYEWTGYIPFDELPHLYNPPEGIIATANGRVVGPRYRWFLTENWMAPYRTARIYDLLAPRKNLRPADFITVQTDVLSSPHRLIAEKLLKARETVRALDPRTRHLLWTLAGWNGRATLDSVQISFLEFTRRSLLWHLLHPRVGAAVGLYEWERSSVFLEKIMRDRPARWLPPEFGSYEELLMTSADLAVQQMELASHHNEDTEWTWSTFSQIRIFHPLGQRGILRRHLSIGPLGISGSMYSVKQVARKFAPAMRFVADLSNPDNSMMNITLGESGQYLSTHYRDQFPAWYEGFGIVSEFSEAAEEKAHVHRLILRPAAP